MLRPTQETNSTEVFRTV